MILKSESFLLLFMLALLGDTISVAGEGAGEIIKLVQEL